MYPLYEFMGYQQATCRYLHIHLINCNIAQQMGMIPLHCAAVRGMSGAVKALVEAKSNVNQKDKVSMN